MEENPIAFTVSLDGNYYPALGEKVPFNDVIINMGGGFQRREPTSSQHQLMPHLLQAVQILAFFMNEESSLVLHLISL